MRFRKSLAAALALCVCAAVAAPVWAIQTGNVITAIGNNGVPIPAMLLGTSQNVSYAAAGGASAQSNAFGGDTTLIVVSVNLISGAAGVRIAIGANPTATSTTTLLPLSGMFYFTVQPGWKIAALSNDTNLNSINVTEAKSWD